MAGRTGRERATAQVAARVSLPLLLILTNVCRVCVGLEETGSSHMCSGCAHAYLERAGNSIVVVLGGGE